MVEAKKTPAKKVASKKPSPAKKEIPVVKKTSVKATTKKTPSVSKKAPVKKVAPKKTVSSKKASTKAVKSVEREIEEAAISVVKKTSTVAKSAMGKAKKAIEGAHLDEKIQTAEKAGKNAFTSAKKKIREAHIEEASKEYLSRITGTLKRLGAKISYKAHSLEEVPTAAGKSISSALIAGKESARRSMATLAKIGKKEPPKQKILGVEMSEEMFRAIVLIFMLALFFYIGTIFGKISAYHHIQHKIYQMQIFGDHMRYEKEYSRPQNMNFPPKETVPEDDVLPLIQDDTSSFPDPS